MKVTAIGMHRFEMPFRTVVRHAAAKRGHTENVIFSVRMRGGGIGYGEACPRPYVTGESPASICAFFARHGDALRRQVIGLESLLFWRDAHVAEIDRNPAAWAGLELAFLDAIGRAEGRSIEQLLGLTPLAGPFRYSAVLGDGPGFIYRLQLLRYRRSGFRDFKLKLSPCQRRNRRKIAPFREAKDGVRVRGDANNLWPDAASCVAALGPCDFPWFALEEPVAAHRLDDCRVIARSLRTRIVLDESFLGREVLERIACDPRDWILNFRISKLGGLTRALDLLGRCRELGLPVIVGAHVGETSLLTRAGLTLAHAAGDLLLAQEGAFGTRLLREDLAEPSITFGEGGLLNPAESMAHEIGGLGLRVRAAGLADIALSAQDSSA